MSHLDVHDLSARADDASLDPDASEHLRVCLDCQQRLATIRALKHSLGRFEAREETSSAVRARVEQLTVQHRSGRRRRRAAWVAGVLLTMSAFMVVAWWLARPAALSEELVADHLRSVPDRLPGEVVSSEAESVRAFFRDRVDFDPVVPTLPDSRLLGGRSCTIRGQRVQLLFYERRQQTLSLFVFGDRIETDGCQHHQGHEVCCHHADDRTLMLVGPLPRRELDRLVHEAVL